MSQAIPLRGEPRLELRRAEIPCPELNRSLYVAVGADWWWYTRLAWDREQWLAYVDRPELETWVGYVSGTPAGYFELESQPGDQVELAYFGLLPSFIGRGLGAELLAAAIDRAWQLRPARVWVHTCTLDHPRALQTYQSRGFEIYKSEEKIEHLPDTPLDFWPRASSGALQLTGDCAFQSTSGSFWHWILGTSSLPVSAREAERPLRKAARMTPAHKPREDVFAVVRVDLPFYQASAESCISIKEVLRTADLAEREVQRLSELNQGKSCYYFAAPTRLFPSGQSAGSS